jgi:hypothetical protein
MKPAKNKVHIAEGLHGNERNPRSKGTCSTPRNQKGTPKYTECNSAYIGSNVYSRKLSEEIYIQGTVHVWYIEKKR